MPDTKITALTAITTVDPAVDVLPIVDVSDTTMAASGTTKKITSNQILGAGGTATLASATITGDLTVDTNTLKVDSANNRVGIGTASPGFALDIIGSSGLGIRIYESSTGNNNRLQITQEGTETRFNSAFTTGSAFYTWQIAGSEQMRLNSTGLGVGVSPGYKLDVAGSSAGVLRLVNINNLSTDPAAVTRLSIDGQGATWHLDNERTNGIFKITRNSTACLTIDNSGNVGIGVTPSYKLHVNGRVSYSTGIGEGADLTLSSTGTQVQHGISSTWTSQNFYTGGTSRVVMKQNGQVRFVPLAADPAGAEAGDVYYNSTSNKLKCYNGTTWNDLF
jgi:hypothetical protein